VKTSLRVVLEKNVRKKGGLKIERWSMAGGFQAILTMFKAFSVQVTNR